MKKISLLPLLLGLSTTAFSAPVNWTPYLKGMQNGCNVFRSGMFLDEGENLQKKSDIPRQLQPSVAQFKVTDELVEIKLKNAVAFGQPIEKIIFQPYMVEDSNLTVKFTNTNFINLIPKFTLTTEISKKTLVAGKNEVYIEQMKWGDNGKVIPLGVNKSLPYNSKMSDRQNIQETLPKDVNVFFYKTNKYGWEKDAKFLASLEFNPKNRTIKCMSLYY